MDGCSAWGAPAWARSNRVPSWLAAADVPGETTVLDLVNLPRLMSVTQGNPEITIALIDGPVNTSLSNFKPNAIRDISPDGSGRCDQNYATACQHGTLVAGVLIGERGSGTPAICPSCTLMLRPIFSDKGNDVNDVPSASAEVLASALLAAINEGARIVNLSCGIARSSGRRESVLRSALGFAASKGVIVLAAAGNQAKLGGSCITTHPWVIPVVSIDRAGRVTNECNLSASIGQRGLAAPGQGLLSIGSDGAHARFSGTSAACPLVTGAAALLWSEYPGRTAAQLKEALMGGRRHRSIVPPIMDAWGAFQRLGARAASKRTV